MQEIITVTNKLFDYCRANSWSGYDPYDALNSKIFNSLPFLDFKLSRIVFTQMLKRSPINFRSLLKIPKTHNPKAIALFLASFLRLSKTGLLDQKDLIHKMAEKLMFLRSKNQEYWCWGYSFPWQTRTLLIPRWAPNLVCTVFVANVFFDAYKTIHEPYFLKIALSSADYIRNLFWSDGKGVDSFSYPSPSMRTRIHNANFLGAALLCRAYAYTKEKKMLNTAMRVARYSASRQADDGSWDYGELPTQKWIDNFHTGYNLCALQSICKYAHTSEFEGNIRRGFSFYRNNFFTKRGAPKYFHDRTYPIDAHCVAQTIITLIELKEYSEDNIKLATYVLRWAIKHMFDEKGYFYYQHSPRYTIRTPYIRWSQAWMLLALSMYLERIE